MIALGTRERSTPPPPTRSQPARRAGRRRSSFALPRRITTERSRGRASESSGSHGAPSQRPRSRRRSRRRGWSRLPGHGGDQGIVRSPLGNFSIYAPGVAAGVRKLSVTIPFVDLAPTNQQVRRGVVGAIDQLITTGQFTNGPAVEQFEVAFADYCGTRRCVGIASGLDALRLALLAAEVPPGSEVIVPANTFAATAEAVVQAGAVPVLADASPTDYNVDPAAAEAAVTSRTAALLPVHLYGQMADMTALAGIARQKGVALIEDACQAHGAMRDGRRAGNVGLAGAFSLHPTKNPGGG